jgi:hypothetical protein
VNDASENSLSGGLISQTANSSRMLLWHSGGQSDMWVRIACVLTFGYLALNRSFSYLGFPAWKIFVGEVSLALLLLFGPMTRSGRWLWASVQLPQLREFRIWYGVFFMWGLIEVVHGIFAGQPLMTVLRDLAFNYYPLFFLLGLWAGIKRPELLPRLLRAFAWFNGIYGILFLLYFNRVEWLVSDASSEVAPVLFFAGPAYSFVALLGLLAYEKSLARSWYLFALNTFVMLGMQFRTEWLALVVGVVVWAYLAGHVKRVLQTCAVFASLFAVLYFTNIRLPSPRGRAEEDFSARQSVDRALAPFRADVGSLEAAEGGGGTDPQEATFVFRTVWWFAIWNAVHADWKTTLWGFGYGFPLGDLVPYLEDHFIRTPHNIFFYALGYTGWIGVIVFVLFQAAILRLLLRARHVSGDSFGVAYWIAVTVYGMFFPTGEAPYGAIPFYLILGCAAAPALQAALAGPIRRSAYAASTSSVQPGEFERGSI